MTRNSVIVVIGVLLLLPTVLGNKKCLDGWEYRASSNKCFRYFEILHDYSTATQHCLDMCGHIAMPYTKNANNDIRHLYTFKHTWIGLHRSEKDKPFIWADGRNVRWNNWDKSQPSDAGLCAILAKNLTWTVVECSEQFTFVCEMPVLLADVYCNVESTQENGHRSTELSQVPMGSVVTYSCNENYVIENGRSKRMCCANRKLSGSSVTCIRDCPSTGWKYSRPRKQCYLLSDKEENYGTATSKCTDLGGTLVLPRTEEENNQLMTYDIDLWIGIHYRPEKKDFLWADNEIIVWKNFFRHALKNRNKKGDCVIHQHRHGNSLFKGTWILNKCSALNKYVCQVSIYKLNMGPGGNTHCTLQLPENVISSTTAQSVEIGESVTLSCKHGFHVISGDTIRNCKNDGTFDGRMLECDECPIGWIKSLITNKCYRVIEETENYITSAENCKQFGGTLAMPKDGIKNTIILGAAGYHRVWLGLSDEKHEGSFEWEDGDLMSWSNWYRGTSNADDRDCVSMRYDGEWIIDNCNKKLYSICEIQREQHRTKCDILLNPNVNTHISESSVMLGTVVEFSCADGYSVVSGDTLRECLANGEFDGSPLVCEKNSQKSCPEEWKQSGSNKCFRFYLNREEYSTAKETCEAQGSTLSTPQSEIENNEIMENRDPRENIWIGLDDIIKEGEYTWADGSILKNLDWENWRPNEPDNYQNGEDCVVMAKSGQWTDAKCSNKNSFVCEKSQDDTVECLVEVPLNGMKSTDSPTVSVGTSVQFSCNKCFVAQEGDASRQCLENGELSGEPLVCVKTCPEGWTTMQASGQCYRLFQQSLTYEAAQAECQKREGSLAMPKSPAEYNKLLEAKSGSRVWIGLNDLEEEGNFKWEDGIGLTWSNWKPGQPDNHRENQHCVHMISSDEWEDNNCSRRYWFLCQLAMSTITEECKS